MTIPELLELTAWFALLASVLTAIVSGADRGLVLVEGASPPAGALPIGSPRPLAEVLRRETQMSQSKAKRTEKTKATSARANGAGSVPLEGLSRVPSVVAALREQTKQVRDAARELTGDVESYSKRTHGPAGFSPALEVAEKHAKKAVEELDKLELSLLAAAGASVMGDGEVKEQTELELDSGGTPEDAGVDPGPSDEADADDCD